MNHAKFKELLSSMPPLPHAIHGQPFDIEKSEAFNWIISQPGVKNWIWSRFRGTGRMQWCGKTKTWRGLQRKAHKEKPEIPDPSIAAEDWS